MHPGFRLTACLPWGIHGPVRRVEFFRELSVPSSVIAIRTKWSFMPQRGCSMRGTGRALLVLALVGLLSGTVAMAADYPTKPIQVFVPAGAGGSTDLLARAVSTVSPKHIPQPLMNGIKAGGGGIPGRVDTVRARPEGDPGVSGTEIQGHRRRRGVPEDHEGHRPAGDVPGGGRVQGLIQAGV
jgi:hypothetical protein